MKTPQEISLESFEALLGWLDTNKERAGEKYEKIRRSLIGIFLGRGVYEAEELADEVINRITHKLPELVDFYTGEPMLYFFGVADKVYLEWLRREKRAREVSRSANLSIESNETKLAIEKEFDCLEKCLAALPADQYRLVTEYYGEDESKKKIRKRLAMGNEMGLSNDALRAKAYRIRARLKECVQLCMAKK